MIAVLLSPVYLLLNRYLLYRLLRWLQVCHRIWKRKPLMAGVVSCYIFLALAIVIAFFLPAGQPRRVLKLIGNYWLGVLLYMSAVIISADLIHLLFRCVSPARYAAVNGEAAYRLVGIVCAVIVCAVSFAGVRTARNIHITPYEVEIEKDGGKLRELNVVLAADLHLGYNIGCRHMEQMVEKINAQHPDLVVIAGDIFDNEYEALDDPKRLAQILGGIQSTYGTYAVYGNHDIEEKILAGFTFSSRKKKMSHEGMDALLAEAGITLLRDEYVLIADSVYLYGRPDYARPGRGITKRRTPQELTAGMDLTKPVLVLDHEPRELKELKEAGVDADLCGHTHDGQLFPANLLIKPLWGNSYGYRKIGGMHSVVTSGVGLFGPNMRVGTIAEICPLKLVFTGTP